MKVQTAILALLLVASAAIAQEVGEGEVGDVDPQTGASAAPSRRLRLHNPATVIHTAGDFSLIGGRKLLASRQLQGQDGDTKDVTINGANNVYSRVGKYCPNDNLPWGDGDNYSDKKAYSAFGDFVHDAGICKVSANGVGKVVTTDNSVGRVYGGAAQDFGTARPNWETYGWSLFKLQGMPSTNEDVKIQGLQLHVLGNTGSKHTQGTLCSVKAVSVAIYNANQVAPFDPTSVNYTKKVDLSRTGETTFTWSSNSSQVLYLDIAQAPDTFPRFDNGKYYWLRVKMFADFGGNTTTGQCYVFWGMSSTITGNDQNVRSRWQERVGGASGYSTTCVGAANSGNTSITLTTSGTASTMNAPGQYQTFWNCWNNGVNIDNSNTGRRCSTYRSTVNPAIPSADCLDVNFRARFNDFNYAFSGLQGDTGVADNNGNVGVGGGGPVDTPISPP